MKYFLIHILPHNILFLSHWLLFFSHTHIIDFFFCIFFPTLHLAILFDHSFYFILYRLKSLFLSFYSRLRSFLLSLSSNSRSSIFSTSCRSSSRLSCSLFSDSLLKNCRSSYTWVGVNEINTSFFPS